MSTFPWDKYIDQHSEDPENKDLEKDSEDELDIEDLNDLTIIEDPDIADPGNPDNPDHFAKEESKLTKKQFTELRSLHGDLLEAEKELEKYIKKPPPGRADLEKEISYIRDALVDLIQGVGIRRITVDKYIYALRKVATYFKVTSETKAISILKKRKLGRFIKTVEVLDMSELRKYLIKKDIIIPGLKKVDKDVSIYIYEKHGEDVSFVKVFHPEGLTGKDIEEFAEKTMTNGFEEKNELKEDDEFNEESKEASEEASEEESKEDKSDEDEPDEDNLAELNENNFTELNEDIDLFSDSIQKMAIVGETSPTSEMLKAARYQTRKALGSGWGVTTSGVSGIGKEVIEEALGNIGGPEFRLFHPLKNAAIDQLNKTKVVYVVDNFISTGDKVSVGGVGPAKVTKVGEVTPELLKKHLKASGYDSVRSWDYDVRQSKGGSTRWKNVYKLETLPKTKKLTIFLKGTVKDQSSEIQHLLNKARTSGVRIFENAPTGQSIDVADAVITIQKRGTVTDAIKHALKRNKKVLLIDEKLKSILLRKSGAKILIKNLGSLVGKVLKGLGGIVPGITILIDAIEIGRLWKDIDTLPEALEKGTMNEDQKKIYEALLRKREASENDDFSGFEEDEFAELKKMAIIGQTSVTPGMLKAARFQAHQAIGAGWGISVYGTTGMHAEVIEETLKTMAVKGRAMQFNVPEVQEYLVNNGTVYTQRSYDLANEVVIAAGAGPGRRTKVGEVTDDLLKKHVGKSGFKSLKEWETAKLKFGKAKKMWLYKVELLPKNDKLTIYLSGKVADQTGAARALLNKAKTYGARIIENTPEGKIITDSKAVVVIKSGHSVPKAAEFAAKAGKPVRMINESLKKFSIVKSGTKYLVKEVGTLAGKFLKGIGRITPGIAIIVDAIELGILWKDIDTLPEALEKGTLNENQQKIYEALQRKQEASEGVEEINLKAEDVELEAGDVDKFVTKGMDQDLAKPEGQWNQLLMDLRLLGNIAYPRLKKGEKWGDWTLDQILSYFGKIVDVLREKVFFSLIPPKKGEKGYDSPYWKCYRDSEGKGYIKTKPPSEEEAKEWAKKRKGIIKSEEDIDLISISNLTSIPKLTSAMMSYFEGFKDENLSGLYLTSPHSELIHTGAKTAIVKSRKFIEHINEPLYLISDKQCYGIIKLSEPEEIDKEEFDERYQEHLVENFERVEWWNQTFPLYLYEVEMIEKFEPVKEVDIPVGIQVFLRPNSIKFK